jgi:hypothetical protein
MHTNPEELPRLWNKYHRLIKKNNSELMRSLQWFMRSIKSDDAIDKFINSWITFNMLYSWIAKVNGEDHHKGIRGLLGKGIPSSTTQRQIIARHTDILNDISQMTLTGRDNKDRGQNLKAALSNNTSQEILIALINAIAIIRHTIFHGSIKDRSNEAERCIWPLLDLNAEIIKHQLERI